MNATVQRLSLTLGAVLIAAGLGAGAFVHAQDQNTSPQPPPFRGGRMGPGGPGGPGRMGGPGGPMGMLPMLGPQLNLTDAQRDQIRAIADGHKDEWKALADRARTAHMALEQTINADSVDDAAIRQRSADASAVDADIAVARAHARAEVFQILTDAQKSQLASMKGPRRGQRQGR
jgi:protein CpxP